MLLTTLALLSAVDGCDQPDGSDEMVVEGTGSVVVGSEKGILGGTTHLSVDEEGDLFIVDQRSSRVVMVPGGDGTPILIGREGPGPGEFDRPVGLGIARDRIHVVDAGKQEVSIWGRDGADFQFMESRALPVASVGSNLSVTGTGRMAIPTQGMTGDSLLVILGPDGLEERRLGNPVARVDGFSMDAIKQDIARGNIPDVNRNFALVALTQNGVWLVLVAEGSVRRYDEDGKLLWEYTLEGRELDAIKQEFLAVNERQRNPQSFYPLFLFTDAQVVDGDLWLLLNGKGRDGTGLWVVGEVGRVLCRITYSDVSGVQQFAVDPDGQKIYFGIVDEATVRRAAIPGNVLEACV